MKDNKPNLYLMSSRNINVHGITHNVINSFRDPDEDKLELIFDSVVELNKYDVIVISCVWEVWSCKSFGAGKTKVILNLKIEE